MKEKERGMLGGLCIVGLLSTLVTTASAQYTGMVDCPFTDGRGYERLDALNNDIQAERERILGGGAPLEEPYSFILCPNVSFDTTTGPLRPVLDNMIIGCGDNLSSGDTCLFLGGASQVELESFSDSTHPVTSVRFQGVTFSDFTEAAVRGTAATDTTTVIFDDVIFGVRLIDDRALL